MKDIVKCPNCDGDAYLTDVSVYPSDGKNVLTVYLYLCEECCAEIGTKRNGKILFWEHGVVDVVTAINKNKLKNEEIYVED